MSQITYTRGQLYETYKESKPELANEFLDTSNYAASRCILNGGITFLVISIIFSAIVFGIVAGATHGFDSYPCLCSGILGIICGPFVIGGLITLAIGYCKKRLALAERLTGDEVYSIARERLIDLTIPLDLEFKPFV